MIMWNVRGINAEKKQRYLDWLINDQRPYIVMFNEAKMTSMLFLGGYFSHQTLLMNHRKVKELSTNLNWKKIPLGGEEVHILNVYLEPGLESFVGKRADTVVALFKSIVR
jgi:exonuclease III